MKKDWRQLLRAIEQAGGVVTLRRSGHYRIDGPGGAYFCPGTPSDPRSHANVIAGLRGIGLDLRGRR